MSETVVALETVLLPLAREFASAFAIILRANPQSQEEFKASLEAKDAKIAELESLLSQKITEYNATIAEKDAKEAEYTELDKKGADLVVQISSIFRPVLDEAHAAIPATEPVAESLPETPVVEPAIETLPVEPVAESLPEAPLVEPVIETPAVEPVVEAPAIAPEAIAEPALEEIL